MQQAILKCNISIAVGIINNAGEKSGVTGC